MPGVELRLVGEAGTTLGDRGKTGRREAPMPSVGAGYRAADDKPSDPPHQPEERFRPDGWFATGDEYLQDPDGFYHHRGRTGDMLRVSGIWISPAEIEDALAGIRSISETAAVLGQSEIGLAEIVLYIVPAPGADGSAAVAAARKQLSWALPSYKRPRRFEIAHDLPRTATGKVQRNKLREQLRRDQATVETGPALPQLCALPRVSKHSQPELVRSRATLLSSLASSLASAGCHISENQRFESELHRRLLPRRYLER